MASSDSATPGGDRQWWYCLRHNKVERGGGCPNRHRLGPFGTEGEASHALQTVAARNRAWDREDEEE